LLVEVISDVICPWCYIGKRRLEKAIAVYGGPVTVRWLPFQLNPIMPEAGICRREYRTKKFGRWERSQQLDAQVAAAGKAEGINFTNLESFPLSTIPRPRRTPRELGARRVSSCCRSQVWRSVKFRCAIHCSASLSSWRTRSQPRATTKSLTIASLRKSPTGPQ
jgi:hypothetical protein